MNNQLLSIAYTLLPTDNLTDDTLNQVMKHLQGFVGSSLCPDATEDDLVLIRQRLEAELGVRMSAGSDLRVEDHQPWLDDVKGELPWHYWSAYFDYLKRSGFNPNALRVLNEDTDNILDLCGNPRLEGAWGVRGLVMGDVQSGKTANYTGLINKAADTGYKVIVLLTGMIEDLRSQSQERLDHGFVGQDSRSLLNDSTRSNIGIGVGERQRGALRPNVLTSVDSDFLTSNSRAIQGIHLQNLNSPVLLVMKKNVSPLRNLVSYLESQISRDSKTLDLPLLLIDDEADNASVNAKKDEDPATINKLIRQVLGKFARSSYVAYTATPFANVFINPDIDDLFPESFVYALNAPSNYIGASSIFTEEGSHANQTQDIEDAEKHFPWSHKKNLQIESLPGSLHTAMETFLLSCAIRDLRKERLKHRSMLVNVTRFTDVQNRLAEVMKNELHGLLEDIKQYLAADSLWKTQPRLEKLHQTWQEQYSDCDIPWDAIRKNLYSSVASIKVVTVNQKTVDTDRLNYSQYRDTEKGRRVIAIGGLTLSRGLTLEGLCVSYFLRNSKAYDTLLQMGRWFGYRPGYEDLCRIWVDPEIQGWFGHVSMVIGELRQDIRRMHAYRHPPKDFGMRVQSHPGSLIVTALNKMRNAPELEVSISFSECGAETPFLPRSIHENDHNLELVRDFLDGLGSSADRVDGRFYWSQIPSGLVQNFLRSLNISSMNMAFLSDHETRERPLVSFIGDNDFPTLQSWDIAIPQGSAAKEVPGIQIKVKDGSDSGVHPRQRQFEPVGPDASFLKLNKLRVGDSTDESVGLSATDKEQAKIEWETVRQQENRGRTIPGSFYRRFRERPLMTISFIEPKDPDPRTSSDETEASPSKRKPRPMMPASAIEPEVLLAISLSFPRYDASLDKKKVKYRMNKVALKNMGLLEDEDSDVTNDDDLD